MTGSISLQVKCKKKWSFVSRATSWLMSVSTTPRSESKLLRYVTAFKNNLNAMVNLSSNYTFSRKSPLSLLHVDICLVPVNTPRPPIPCRSPPSHQWHMGQARKKEYELKIFIWYTMDLDKTMEIGFSKLFLQYFHNISILWKRSNLSSVSIR